MEDVPLPTPHPPPPALLASPLPQLLEDAHRLSVSSQIHRTPFTLLH